MAALDVLLCRAQKAGAVRDDVVVHDVPALCMVAARLPSWRLDRQPELWTRYLALLTDGLRPEGATELGHEPPLPVAGAGAAPAPPAPPSGARAARRRYLCSPCGPAREPED